MLSSKHSKQYWPGSTGHELEQHQQERSCGFVQRSKGKCTPLKVSIHLNLFNGNFQAEINYNSNASVQFDGGTTGIIHLGS